MRLFGARGIPCVMAGPSGIERAHAVDEWVAVGRARRGRADGRPARHARRRLTAASAAPAAAAAAASANAAARAAVLREQAGERGAGGDPAADAGRQPRVGLGQRAAWREVLDERERARERRRDRQAGDREQRGERDRAGGGDEQHVPGGEHGQQLPEPPGGVRGGGSAGDEQAADQRPAAPQREQRAGDARVGGGRDRHLDRAERRADEAEDKHQRADARAAQRAAGTALAGGGRPERARRGMGEEAADADDRQRRAGERGGAGPAGGDADRHQQRARKT